MAPSMTDPATAELLAVEPMTEMSMEGPSRGIRAHLGNLASRAGDIVSSAGYAIHTGYEAVTDRLDSIKDRATTLAAIGGVAFVGAQAAELASNVEPVTADTGNTPGAVASGGLAKYCASKMANLFPNATYMQQGHRGQLGSSTVLWRPGQRNQWFAAVMDTEQAPDQCVQAGYKLEGTVTGYVGQPKLNGHRDKPYRMLTLHYGNKARHLSRGVENKSKRADGYYYQRTPGKAKTPVFLQFDNKVVDPHGHVVKEKTRRHGVPVLNGHAEDVSG